MTLPEQIVEVGASGSSQFTDRTPNRQVNKLRWITRALPGTASSPAHISAVRREGDAGLEPLRDLLWRGFVILTRPDSFLLNA